MFNKYQTKPEFVYAQRWLGGEIPEELKDDQRIKQVIKSGVLCLEVTHGEHPFATVSSYLDPGDYIVWLPDNRILCLDERSFLEKYQES